MTVRRYPDPDALAHAAADDLDAIVREAVAARGTCSIALSGGGTPKRMFQVLAERGRAALPWHQIELWWGDERTVSADHPDSNYGMALHSLIEPLGIDPARVHRMHGEDDPVAAAAAYEQTLVTACGLPPVLDLVLLGLGPDGHTASLFPGSPALTEPEHFVVANPVDSPLAGGQTMRITFTARTINAARKVRFVISGGDKAEALAGILEGPKARYPAQLIENADLVWLVDDDAASRLPREGS